MRANNKYNIINNVIKLVYAAGAQSACSMEEKHLYSFFLKKAWWAKIYWQTVPHIRTVDRKGIAGVGK